MNLVRDTRPRKIGRLALQLAIFGLVVRAAIPLGYMPGNLLAGEFMVLCPTAVPAAVLQVLAGHDHGHADHTIDSDRDCPIGSALQTAWAPGEYQQSVTELAAIWFAVSRTDSLRSTTTVRHYQVRAPPVI